MLISLYPSNAAKVKDYLIILQKAYFIIYISIPFLY